MSSRNTSTPSDACVSSTQSVSSCTRSRSPSVATCVIVQTRSAALWLRLSRVKSCRTRTIPPPQRPFLQPATTLLRILPIPGGSPSPTTPLRVCRNPPLQLTYRVPNRPQLRYRRHPRQHLRDARGNRQGAPELSRSASACRGGLRRGEGGKLVAP